MEHNEDNGFFPIIDKPEMEWILNDAWWGLVRHRFYYDVFLKYDILIRIDFQKYDAYAEKAFSDMCREYFKKGYAEGYAAAKKELSNKERC